MEIISFQALGARCERAGDGLRIAGIGGVREPFQEPPRLDCGESGSTLRFLIPISLETAGGGVFTGRGRLMERPSSPISTSFRKRGLPMGKRTANSPSGDG